MNSKHKIHNHYHLNHTRGSTATSIKTTASAPTTLRSSTTRNSSSESRTREKVSRLSTLDKEDSNQYNNMHKNIKSTIPTAKNVKPNLKRVRVVKFQKPLSDFNIANNNLTILRNVSSNLNQNMAECNATKKRLRKVVHKIKLVESSKQQNQSLDLKSYKDQHALSSKTAPTARDIFQTNKDGINLEEIVKQDHQATSVFKNTIQTVINNVNRGYYKNQYSENKPMSEMLNVSQALGNFGQGLSNDTTTSSINESENSTDAYSKTHPRAFIRRKLVAKRPFNLLPTTIPAKATLALGNVRPTKTVIRSKKKPSNPFNTNTQNKNESFLRKESRKSPLQNTVRLTQQNKYLDYEDQKDLPYTPLNSQPSGVTVFNRRPKSRQPHGDEDSEKKKGEDVDNEGKKHNRIKELFTEDTHKKVLIKANTSLANLLSDYSSRENRLLPAGNTSRINVSYNPHIRQPNISYPSAPDKQIQSIYIPHLVKRPPVSTISNLKSNLTQRPVAKNYEHTTPLTPLKAAPFIPSNTRNYERKYTGHISETEELVSDKSQIENLNINALNARNKKIFNIQSRKHAMVKPKVVYTANSEIEAELINEQFKQNQGYVTTTPSIPSVPLGTDTLHFVTENDSAQPQNLLFTLANEVRNISSFKQDNKFSSLLSTTPPTPPATTLMHVFTLVEKVSDIDETSKRRPLISKTTDMDSKLKLIEINRIVEINSKLDSTAQRNSKATQELNDMHVEALPHVELLGEISVVKFVHLVDGRNIEIIDGHSMVTDNAPTESIIPKKAEQQTIHDKNVSRKPKSLLPEVIRGNFETSTLSLEGLFDSTRMAKQITMNKSIAADLETMQERSSQLEESVVNKTVSQTKESALPVTNNHYHLNHTRGSTATSIKTTASAPTTLRSSTTRNSSSESRTREKVSRLSTLDKEDSNQYNNMHKNIKSTIPTAKNVKPNLKRVRVVKFQKPLSDFNIANNNLTILRNVSSNLNQNMAECNATKKRLRKVVHKIKLVESSKQQNQSLDLKSYKDQHALSSKTAPTARDIFQTNKDGINLEEIVKQDHQATSVFKNTIQTVINNVNRGYYKNQYSEIKPMSEMLNVSQALGNFGQGLSNDTTTSSINESENSTDAYSKTHPRAFIRRKLVAKRPFNLLPTTIPAKATLALGNVRPTKTVIRSKKKPSNPFNTNTQNKNESFLRKESRKSPLQNTVRLTQQNKYLDYEDQKDLPYTPLNSQPSGVTVFNRRPKSRQPHGDEDSEKKKGEDVDNEGKKHNRIKELFTEDTHKKVLIKANTSLANLLSDYSSRENRLLPAGNTSRINVSYNPHIRQPNISYPSAPDKQIQSIYIPHLVKRPPVSTISNLKSNLTQRPVAKNYEHTTPLTPLKAAPFIPSNTRNYERKYTGHISETEELVSDKSQIENLNINALNARNKKIFNIQSRKHAMVKPKVVYTANSEIEAELINEQFKQNQGYVTTTPSIPSVPLGTDTLHFVTENDSAQPQNLLFTLANEVRNISSFKQDNKFSSLLSTTPPTPPATTLMHVFTLVEKVSDIDETSKRRPLISKTTDMDSKLKLIEINRIVEINSKLDSTAQRNSKATQELNDMHVEALPHVELLGEISVVKFVHLVDGRNIEIIDGHSMVTDNAPTESIIPKKAEQQTIHDKNVSRKPKSLLPEVIRGNFETSTLSLEGLFDSTRMAKQITMNKSIAADLETMQERSSQLEESVVNKTVSQTKESALPVTNVRAMVPLLRPNSNESSTLIISIANLDKVILRKSSAPVEESNDIQSNTNKSSDFNSD